MRYLFTILLLTVVFACAQAQNYSPTFIDYQRTLPRPGEALKKKEDTLQRQFKAKGLDWAAKYLYIRSFKYDWQLEI